MKKLFILTLIPAVFIGFGIISCIASPSTPPKTDAEILKLNDQAIDYMEAKQFDKALEIFKVLEDKFPPNQVTIYNIACAHSLAGRKKDGVFYARKAVQYGWSDWKKMDADADLDNIRNEDDYIKLMAALQIIYPDGAKNPPDCQGKCKEKGTSHQHPHKHPHEPPDKK